jgi:hypothetical protein
MSGGGDRREGRAHMPADDLDKTEPPRLAEMLALDGARPGRVWRADDLAAVLRHQLDAPLEFDLGDLSEEYANLAPPGEPGSLHWRVTFGQLLHHARPPLPLVERAKRFAKACRNHPDGPLPVEVATVLYFACIVVARLRCDGGPRISALDDPALVEGLCWALAQPWLDQRTRELFVGGVEHLTK